MELYEEFGIAAFRSRQQVINFDNTLRKRNIQTQVMSTPKEVSIGCGLSVRFDVRDMDKVIYAYKMTRPSALIGFYKVQRTGTRTMLTGIEV